MSIIEDHRIYAGRAIAAPMVRVSHLGFRVMCSKQGADACFSEELVSLKLKKTVREVVTYPVPLQMLPVGYRLPAAAIESAINSAGVGRKSYEDEDEAPADDVAEKEMPIPNTLITSIYLVSEEPYEKHSGSFLMDDDANNKTNGDDADAFGRVIGDVTCYPEDLNESILGAGSNTRKEDAVNLFRGFFNISASSSTTTVSAEALVEFLAASSSTFLPPSEVIAHIPAVELIMYEPFKRGFRRAVSASFLPKQATNPFPEGDRRPEGERLGSPFAAADALSSSVLPRVNDVRCVQVICQLGAANATDAALAASVMSSDVDGFDVNMGCPKAFSVANGMGAALMKVPAEAGHILRAIHHRINCRGALSARNEKWWGQKELEGATKPTSTTAGMVIPISFKTRIFGSTEDSIHHLSTVVANCIRPKLANKRTRDEESQATIVVEDVADDIDNNDANANSPQASSVVDFPCPLHAISLHARTREQRSESDPLTTEATTIMNALREVEDVYVSLDSVSGAETFKPTMRSSASLASKASAGVITLANHIPNMTFIFNGSVAADGRNAVPSPTFHGALIGRHCMWDMSVFNNYKHVTHHTFGTNEKVSAASHPVPIAVGAHTTFQDVLQWALPPPSGRTTADWIAARAKVTDAERFAVQQCALIYIDLLSHFAAYHNNSMYAKYHYTRSFAEFPFSKLTCHELEFLFVRDEETTPEALEEAANAFSKLSGKARGDKMTFTLLQSAGGWMDFYLALRKMADLNWGLVKRRAADGSDALAVKKPQSKADMEPMKRFLFNTTPRGDEILEDMPHAAHLAAARK